MSRIDWVDPARGRVSLGEVAEEYLASRSNVAPLTQGTDKQMYRQHIGPTFGKRVLARITAAEITEWLGRLADREVAPSTRRRALAVLRGILAHAVADRRLRMNPAVGVKGPKGGVRREGIALTVEEVSRLLAELPEECRPPVILMAITGIRVSEMCGLRVGDVYRSPQGYTVSYTHLDVYKRQEHGSPSPRCPLCGMVHSSEPEDVLRLRRTPLRSRDLRSGYVARFPFPRALRDNHGTKSFR